MYKRITLSFSLIMVLSMIMSACGVSGNGSRSGNCRPGDRRTCNGRTRYCRPGAPDPHSLPGGELRGWQDLRACIRRPGWRHFTC